MRYGIFLETKGFFRSDILYGPYTDYRRTMLIYENMLEELNSGVALVSFSYGSAIRVSDIKRLRIVDFDLAAM